jgi:hypothetical protein
VNIGVKKIVPEVTVGVEYLDSGVQVWLTTARIAVNIYRLYRPSSSVLNLLKDDALFSTDCLDLVSRL